ncbi:MAG: hypothetical protein HY775_13605 [Acidobacteria bacterium]|nr:hypothetical protein [Acidobacteriota bacterium]
MALLAVATSALPAPGQGTTIPGTPSGATGPAHARHVFQVSNGNLVFLDAETVGGSSKVVYRISSDQGQTWGAPVVLDSANASAGIDAVQVGTKGPADNNSYQDA